MTKQVQRRRGSSTQHTGFTGAEGEISVNTTNKSVHVHDGVTAGGFEAARADLNNVDSTANLSINNLTVTGDVSFGDNDKAIFGAGDLQIYHDGSHSYINEAGSGNLYLLTQGTEISLLGNTSAEFMARFIQDGAVELYHNGSTKLATTATGCDITGTVTATKAHIQTASSGSSVASSGDELFVEGSGDAGITVGAGNTSKASLFFADDGDSAAGRIRYDHSDNSMQFGTNGQAEHMRISGGNVGIGGITNPAYKLVVSAGGASGIEFGPAFSGTANLIQHYSRSGASYVDAVNIAAQHRFTIGGSEAMRISGDNLLVGRTSVGTTGTGHSIRGADSAVFARAGGEAIVAARNTNDGQIIRFDKDGTTVGSIGTASSYLTIGSGVTGLLFDDVSDKSIRPWNLSTNTASHADIDLGLSTQRFRDLYLSGLLIGGVGAISTGGTLDWNDASNARSGNGFSLLLGSATNGPGGSTYFHSFCFEYQNKDGTGNMTQWAIGYIDPTLRYMRCRYLGTWTSWYAF